VGLIQDIEREHLIKGKDMKQIFQLFCLYILIFLATITCHAQSSENNLLPDAKRPRAKALVVYFSRTANTEAMAKEIAKRFQADLVPIKAEAYGKDFMGQLRAGFDAWNEDRMADIQPETTEMSQYNLIFLGAPIWWYRPAVPLWTFVEKNNFYGKPVVLFSTFNSKFKQKYIEEFKGLVEHKNGRFLDHVYVRRGRIYDQINRDELLKQVNELLEAKKKKWNSIINP
jgi:flavodoxin